MSQTQPRPQHDRRPTAPEKPASDQAPDEEEELLGGNRFILFNVMPSWMVSFVTHIVVIIILAVLVIQPRPEPSITFEVTEQAAQTLDDASLSMDALDLDSDSDDSLETDEELMSDALESVAAPDEMDAVLQSDAELFDSGFEVAPVESLFGGDAMGELTGASEISARTGDLKKAALAANGGTPGSEEAVQLALKWIVDHQLEDGSWSLDHTEGPGNHRDSPNPGMYPEAKNGATALALLPLLGAGNTHMTGQYKKEVRYGLEYLKRKAKKSGRGVSFIESRGTMYSHGLCAIVFCEAYAMTKDPELLMYAQGALWYTEDSQDPVGGGWRYRPRERGDTSAVGWQLMALKSGKMMGLDTNLRTYKRAAKFLDSVSTSGGSFYGYMTPPLGRPADARTAVGLLCRMYLGWDRDVPGLVDGVEAISAKGPSMTDDANMYYNYYATQVIKHMYNGQREWKDWNVQMREFLIDTQAKDGNARGSWHFGNDHASSVGGRLYNTSMACMTLEVYYRFLPLYADKAAGEQFELLD